MRCGACSTPNCPTECSTLQLAWRRVALAPNGTRADGDATSSQSSSSRPISWAAPPHAAALDRALHLAGDGPHLERGSEVPQLAGCGDRRYRGVVGAGTGADRSPCHHPPQGRLRGGANFGNRGGGGPQHDRFPHQRQAQNDRGAGVWSDQRSARAAAVSIAWPDQSEWGMAALGHDAQHQKAVEPLQQAETPGGDGNGIGGEASAPGRQAIRS